MPPPGVLSVALDAETTRMLLGEVPAAFHAGVHDILLIAFGLAVAEFLGTGGAPIAIDVEGHGRHEELAPPTVDLSRTVGWFTTKYPVALTVGGLDWAQVIAGERGVGRGGQGRQRTTASPARRSDLRAAALPERRRRTRRVGSADRVQLPGPPGLRRRAASNR